MSGLSFGKALWVLMLLIQLAKTANGAEQTINFEDLLRPGSELSKTITIPGIGQAGESQIRKFSEVDQARTEESKRNRASSSSGGAGGGSIKFTCKVECRGSFWASGGKSEFEVLASSEDQAQKYLEEKGLCKGSRGKDALGSSSSTSYAAIFCNRKY